MGLLYASEVCEDLRNLRGRNPVAYRVAIDALRRLEKIGPLPDGLSKRVLLERQNPVCQFWYSRLARTIVLTYELEAAESHRLLDVSLRAGPR